jgi:hypothetical protein
MLRYTYFHVLCILFLNTKDRRVYVLVYTSVQSSKSYSLRYALKLLGTFSNHGFAIFREAKNTFAYKCCLISA